jgi:hypothetical protein
MDRLFEVIDKSRRKIRLTKKQWSHIIGIHPELSNYFEELQKTLEKPIKIVSREKGNLNEYYSYQKNRKYSEKYLRLIVKYLNGDGFIITAHFTRTIK